MHLRPLHRQGLIEIWHDRDISAGTEWEHEISQHLNNAQIILLLVSPNFMASEYCYSIEMKRAIERHEQGDALVIPIILRHVDWEGVPFYKLQALPNDSKPVLSRAWRNADEAFVTIAQAIRKEISTVDKRSLNQKETLLESKHPIIKNVDNKDWAALETIHLSEEEIKRIRELSNTQTFRSSQKNIILPEAFEDISDFGTLSIAHLSRPVPHMFGSNEALALRVKEGKEPGRIFEIKDELKIGRHRSCHIFLEDIKVSRLHASIHPIDNGSYVLKDLGSTNGTKVNGKFLKKDQALFLEVGDEIQIGQTIFVFILI